MPHPWPNNPLELTAHSAGFLVSSWSWWLWTAAQRGRSAAEVRRKSSESAIARSRQLSSNEAAEQTHRGDTSMDLSTIDHLLTTTRSVRRRLDLTRPVEREVIARCIDIAIQAPNGGNFGRYHFVVVTDPTKRAGIADIYRKVMAEWVLPQRELYGPGLL